MQLEIDMLTVIYSFSQFVPCLPIWLSLDDEITPDCLVICEYSFFAIYFISTLVSGCG